jgi:hypothetical protein
MEKKLTQVKAGTMLGLTTRHIRHLLIDWGVHSIAAQHTFFIH